MWHRCGGQIAHPTNGARARNKPEGRRAIAGPFGRAGDFVTLAPPVEVIRIWPG
ncbi:hypothetical protein Ga0080574_TMP4118 [Salipiger abyssi]|uniref:Uncharacterized protein n=1 Tax=Salipiger abyssi TaxID=1250539 RepID=A0A1P8UYH8_9RHOB|nr:hypothetical protein Ga0080574_TMP4118 [Salipiger abyssi]